MIAAAQNFVGQTHNMVVDGKIQKREYIIPPDEDSDDEEHSEEEVTLSETEESNDKSDEDDSFIYEDTNDDAEEGELVSLGTSIQTTERNQGEEEDSEATCDENIDPEELLEETLVIDEGDEMETKPNVDEIRASFKNGEEKAFVNLQIRHTSMEMFGCKVRSLDLVKTRWRSLKILDLRSGSSWRCCLRAGSSRRVQRLKAAKRYCLKCS